MGLAHVGIRTDSLTPKKINFYRWRGFSTSPSTCVANCKPYRMSKTVRSRAIHRPSITEIFFVLIKTHLQYLRDNRVRFQSRLTRTPDRFTCFKVIDKVLHKPRVRVRKRGLIHCNLLIRFFQRQVPAI